MTDAISRMAQAMKDVAAPTCYAGCECKRCEELRLKVARAALGALQGEGMEAVRARIAEVVRGHFHKASYANWIPRLTKAAMVAVEDAAPLIRAADLAEIEKLRGQVFGANELTAEAQRMMEQARAERDAARKEQRRKVELGMEATLNDLKAFYHGMVRAQDELRQAAPLLALVAEWQEAEKEVERTGITEVRVLNARAALAAWNR